MRYSRAILFTAAASLLSALSHATSLTEIPKAGLSTNDLTFTAFQSQLTHVGFATPHNAQAMDVATVAGSGIRFSGNFYAAVPPLAALFEPGFSSYSDATIGFAVKSANGIDKIGLDFDGNAWGASSAAVDETIFDGNGTRLGSLSVACFGADFGGGCKYTDTLLLNALYKDLYVVEDISAQSLYGEGWLSHVDQTFCATPEPGAFALIGAGLIGMTALLRRRVAAVKA